MSDLDKYRKLLNHQPNDESDEMAEFLAWTEKADVPKGANKEALWAKIDARITEESKAPEKKVIRLWPILAVTASVTFLFLFFATHPVIHS